MAGEDTSGGGGGEALPEAGGPLFEMERLTYDEAYNLVREERLGPQTGPMAGRQPRPAGARAALVDGIRFV